MGLLRAGARMGANALRKGPAPSGSGRWGGGSRLSHGAPAVHRSPPPFETIREELALSLDADAPAQALAVRRARTPEEIDRILATVEHEFR